MAMNDSIPETITIQLTKDQRATVDFIDADLAQINWQAQRCDTYASGVEYLARRQYMIGKKRIMQYMHRTILQRMIGRDLLTGEIVDHINGNPLDNRRENLRLATRSQNNMNRKKSSRNKSGFKGVSFHKQSSKWVARVGKEGKYKHLGLFNTPEEAYAVYLEASKAKEWHGEFANPG